MLLLFVSLLRLGLLLLLLLLLLAWVLLLILLGLLLLLVLVLRLVLLLLLVLVLLVLLLLLVLILLLVLLLLLLFLQHFLRVGQVVSGIGFPGLVLQGLDIGFYCFLVILFLHPCVSHIMEEVRSFFFSQGRVRGYSGIVFERLVVVALFVFGVA